MVRRRDNKNNVINNKNIIQICCDKPVKDEKQDNGKKQKSINYLKDNAMESQPFNLVNSLACFLISGF